MARRDAEPGHLKKRPPDRRLSFADAIFAIILALPRLELKSPNGLSPIEAGLRQKTAGAWS